MENVRYLLCSYLGEILVKFLDVFLHYNFCYNLKEEGYFENKFGYQLGYKIFNAFGIENLTLQTEYNFHPHYFFLELVEIILLKFCWYL